MFEPLTGHLAHSLNQRSREYTRQRQMGIGDLLLENRIVFLDGVITDSTANLIVMKLLFLQSENRHQDVHLYVNSPGGSVTATMAIYDTMQYLESAVATYCVGLAASLVHAKDPDAIMAVMPADHVIHPAEEFQRALQHAAEAATAHLELDRDWGGMLGRG